jgi:hypothetical protein
MPGSDQEIETFVILNQWEVSDVLPEVKQKTVAVFRVLQEKQKEGFRNAWVAGIARILSRGSRRSEKSRGFCRGSGEKKKRTREGDLPGNRSEKCAF